jgi:hypothetical protein
MNCIVCKRPLADIHMATDGNQPHGGTEFTGGGDYGSAVTDDEYRYCINVCDPCIIAALKDETCKPFRVQPRARPLRIYVNPKHVLKNTDGGICPTISDDNKNDTPKP